MLVGVSGTRGASDAGGVVPLDLTGQSLLELGHGHAALVVAVKHLVLQVPEESLAREIVHKQPLRLMDNFHLHSFMSRIHPGYLSI